MPYLYTAEEYANMHFIYGECRGNASEAARLYRERYPNAERHPDHRVFVNVHVAYSEGRLPSARTSGGRSRTYDDDTILAEIENQRSREIQRNKAKVVE